MERDPVMERYKELACEVIVSIINDWLEDKKADEYKLYDDFQKCDWFDYLDLDRDYLFIKCLHLRKKGTKHVRFRGNGSLI